MDQIKTYEELQKENANLRRSIGKLRRKHKGLYKTIRKLENALKTQNEAKKDKYKNRRR